jgi:hypothetical protein
MTITAAEREYHLTANGWVEGPLDRCFTTARRPTTPPADRVATYVVSYEENEIYGTDEGSTARLIWQRDDVGTDELSRLFATFPPPWR